VVTFAVALLAVSAESRVAGIVAPGVNWDDPLSYVVLTIMAGVPALLIGLIFHGRNWARWAFLVLCAVGRLLSPRSCLTFNGYSSGAAAGYCLERSVLLAAAVALCSRPARQWFGGGTDEC
jgi:hypothetical protein